MPLRTVLSATLFVALAGCGEPAPTTSWSANLDARCNPHDPIDGLRARFTPETFWAEQVADMQARLRGAETKTRNARYLLTENRDGRDQFRAGVQQRAFDLGMRGEQSAKMIAANMADFDALAAKFEATIAAAEIERQWARRCLALSESNLRLIRSGGQVRPQPKSGTTLELGQ